MKKRLLAIVLALVIVLGMLPTAFAAERYTDVGKNDWFYKEVTHVTGKGLMDGVTEDTFAPKQYTNRAEVVTALYRQEGSPAPTCPNPFTDVEAVEGDTDEAIIWASCVGIVEGYGDGRFGPADPVAREQLAVILYRYYNYKNYDYSDTVELGFTDSGEISDWALDAMKWAVAVGVLEGMGDGTVNPKGNAERSHVAAMLYRELFCEVTFDTNWTRGEDTVVVVDRGDTVEEISTPHRAGYYFGGWFANPTSGRSFNFNTPITEDITLYAHWYGIVIPTPSPSPSPSPSPDPAPGPSGPLTHEHRYGNWEPNADGTHRMSCTGPDGTCDAPTITAPCSNWSAWAWNNVVEDPATTEKESKHSHTCSDCGYVATVDCGFDAGESKTEIIGSENVTTIVYTCTESNCGSTYSTIANTAYSILYVKGGNNALTDDLATAVAEADANSTITLFKDISVTEQITVNKAITINGNGKTITATGTWSQDAQTKMIMSINNVTGAVTITDLTLDCGNTVNAWGLQAWKSSNVKLENVTVSNINAATAYAGLTINASSVTATNINIDAGLFGSVNVDPKDGDARFELDDASSLAESKEIWADSTTSLTMDLPVSYYHVVMANGTHAWTKTDPTSQAQAKIVVGEETVYYETLAIAVADAESGNTIDILHGEITGEAIKIETNKSLTFRGANAGKDPNGTDWDSTIETVITVPFYVNDHNIGPAASMTFEGLTFKTTGSLRIRNVKSIVIRNNKFVETDPGDGINYAIYAHENEGKNVSYDITVQNNYFNDIHAGICLHAPAKVTIQDNVISNVKANVFYVNETIANRTGDININNNTVSNWGTGSSGRVLRAVLNGDPLNFTGNKMTHENAPEEFVKITGTGTVAATDNTWNGGMALILGEYHIYTVDQLKAFRNAVNTGNSFKGETVKLMANIDLTNENWTPIGTGTEAAFSGTFDGNGKTISNLTINGGREVGLFGTAWASSGSVVIKNLTMTNANITGEKSVGVIAGVCGTCTTIDNCTVTVSVVTGIPAMVNSAYDDGDDVGAIAGHTSTPLTAIKNCKVVNVKITAFRDVGGVTGYAGPGAQITGNIVTNTTITQDKITNSYNHAALTSGKVVGNPDASATVSNNTAENDVTVTVLLADGVAYDNSATYSISKKEGMFWFADQVNTQSNNFDGKTVKLTADIDLNKEAWTPIGQTGATRFQGTFDGQNYTISNLNIDSSAQTGANYSSGLFGWVDIPKDTVIKNVKVNGATVKGNHNCAVIVGYLYGTVENCHVSNATVTCAHANDDACGDKAGTIVGYAGPATDLVMVTNCSAKDSSVIAGRDGGQLIGAGYTASVSGCSATNVTVTAKGDCTGANINNAVIGRVLG